MNRHCMHAIRASLLASGVALLATSCAHLSLPSSGMPAAAPKPKNAGGHQRIAQVSFGREAQYVVCAEPACPKVTPKSGVTVQAAHVGSPVLPVSAPANAPKEPPVAQRPTPTRLTVHFAPGMFALNEQGKRALDDALPAVRRAKRIVVMGRTDNEGAVRTNELLARQRALAVRDYLQRGLAGANPAIVIDARGACCFVSGNDTAAGRRENRRVDIEFHSAG